MKFAYGVILFVILLFLVSACVALPQKPAKIQQCGMIHLGQTDGGVTIIRLACFDEPKEEKSGLN